MGKTLSYLERYFKRNPFMVTDAGVQIQHEYGATVCCFHPDTNDKSEGRLLLVNSFEDVEEMTKAFAIRSLDELYQFTPRQALKRFLEGIGRLYFVTPGTPSDLCYSVIAGKLHFQSSSSGVEDWLLLPFQSLDAKHLCTYAKLQSLHARHPLN